MTLPNSHTQNFSSTQTPPQPEGGDLMNQAIQAQPATAQRAQWLLSLGCSPLPVAPAQDAETYPALDKSGEIIYDKETGLPKPKFNGKNPSFLGTNGKPYLLAHERYQNAQPTADDLAKWFANPKNGIGTLTGQGGIDWIDLDRKRFDSQEACDNARAMILEKCDRTYYETTRSGGSHIAVKLNEPKSFTNFQLGPDGRHAGEFLGEGGFIVLSPTPGYVSQNGDAIAAVQSAAALGLAKAVSAETNGVQQPALTTDQVTDSQPKSFSGSIQLENIIARSKAQYLTGSKPSGDFSRTLTAFARECYGWENFLDMRGVSHDSAKDLIDRVAEILGVTDKGERILAKIIPADCVPGLERKKDVAACESLLKAKLNPKKAKASWINDIVIRADDTPGRLVWREIYANGDPHITLGDEVYKFVGTHYELVNEGKRRNQIARVLDKSVSLEEDQFQGIKATYPYAHDRSVKDAINYTKALMPAVAWNDVNKSGINCKNGVLCWHWDNEGKLVKELMPHDPALVFLAEPKVEYNPDADDSHFNRLLEAVEPEHRAIVLRTLAASFDLNYIRSKQHRAVRILAMLGGGSNGKDALKDAMTAILSNQGVTSVPLVAFALYDQGKQFGLASLAGSRINWPSENSFSAALDGIESLKALVTGETLQREIKNRQAEEFRPNCVPIFNGNAETLKLMLGNEAIASRYGIVPFNKTFKRKPDPFDSNELEADPRFRNLNWLAENVCSAMLNRLMAELENAATEGIDYSPVQEIMQGHVLSSFHLAEFIADSNLVESKGDRVSVNVLWERLKTWYQDEGILKIDESGREVWTADDRVGDKFYKSSRQMSAAIVKFIPQATNKGASARSNTERFIVNIAWGRAGMTVNEIEKTTKPDTPVQPDPISQVVSPEVVADPIMPVESGESTLKKGDNVVYIGNTFANYQGLELKVHSVKGGAATCVKPDGRFTTNLRLEELMPDEK